MWRASLEAPLVTNYFLQRILSEDEVEIARRFRFEKDRLHWIAAHGILRLLLGNYLDIDPRKVLFMTNNYGKPFIAYPSHGTRLHFNLAHSDNLALYAFTYDRHIGVDVEYIRPNIDCEALAQRYFSPYERTLLQTLPLEVRREAFFLCWSRKEAYIKARGKGFSIPLDQFDVSLIPGEPAVLLDSREDPQSKTLWSLRTLTPGPACTGTLVVQGNNWQLSCWHLTNVHEEEGRLVGWCEHCAKSCMIR